MPAATIACQGCGNAHHATTEGFTDTPIATQAILRGQLCELCVRVLRDAGWNPTILSRLVSLLTGISSPPPSQRYHQPLTTGPEPVFNLPQGGLFYGSTAPNTGQGQAGALGSFYFAMTGTMWKKTGTSATAWTQC